MTNLEARLEIPDLWFDFYARFLPGVVLVAAIRRFVCDKADFPESREMIVLGIAAFISGMVMQAVSSPVAHGIEDRAGRVKDFKRNNRDYIEGVIRRLGSRSNDARILGKMHAEVVFFLQLGLSAIIVVALHAIKNWQQVNLTTSAAVAGVTFLASYLLAVGVAIRRLHRAVRKDKAPKNTPSFEAADVAGVFTTEKAP